MAGGSKRALYGTCENGWMDTNLFSSWFKKGFLTWTKDMPRPLLLIFDRHMSHRPDVFVLFYETALARISWRHWSSITRRTVWSNGINKLEYESQTAAVSHLKILKLSSCSLPTLLRNMLLFYLDESRGSNALIFVFYHRATTRHQSGDCTRLPWTRQVYN